VNIPEKTIDELVEEGRLYLFQIYNKDFSACSKGRKNLHTLYWTEMFGEDNLKNASIKLRGEAEIFFREKSSIEKIAHRTGETMVNKRDKEGNPIPDEIYKELFNHFNGNRALSGEASAYVDSVRRSIAKYEIVKDKRYLSDKILFHVPIMLNFKSTSVANSVNKLATEFIVDNKDLRIIGIDRGEKNLLYISIIDREGNIIDQKSFNVIGGYDYRMKLDQREKDRNESRRSWSSLNKITDLKEGYLSAAVH
jgi:CRISPR-associated protein Cpf1